VKVEGQSGPDSAAVRVRADPTPIWRADGAVPARPGRRVAGHRSRKEMYNFVGILERRGVTLRPENNAGVVRAAIEHSCLSKGLDGSGSLGPMFRHERPQRGRPIGISQGRGRRRSV